jgi:hypothetical protein
VGMTTTYDKWQAAQQLEKELAAERRTKGAR